MSFATSRWLPRLRRPQRLFRKAQEAGVKTAFAASYRYQPYALLAKSLVAEGAIGEPLEVECVSHFNLDPLIPFGWSHRLDGRRAIEQQLHPQAGHCPHRAGRAGD